MQFNRFVLFVKFPQSKCIRVQKLHFRKGNLFIEYRSFEGDSEILHLVLGSKTF